MEEITVKPTVSTIANAATGQIVSIHYTCNRVLSNDNGAITVCTASLKRSDKVCPGCNAKILWGPDKIPLPYDINGRDIKLSISLEQAKILQDILHLQVYSKEDIANGKHNLVISMLNDLTSEINRIEGDDE